MYTARVRRRAIEVAADSRNFEPGALVPEFELPGDAKLEADARLAVCIDAIAHRLAASRPHQEYFLNKFHRRVRGEHSRGTRNSRIPTRSIGVHFMQVFEAVYPDGNIIKEVLGSPFGVTTGRACSQYVENARSYITRECPAKVRQRYVADSLRIGTYERPNNVIKAGISTIGIAIPDIIAKMRHTGLSPEIHEQYLTRLDRRLRATASLSLNQFQSNGVTSGVNIDDSGTITDDAELLVARGMPRYRSGMADLAEQIRPYHGGCPAMPDLPASERLHGGSSISTLWVPTGRLLVATAVHALNDNRPHYSMVERAYDNQLKWVPFEKSPEIR